MLLKSSTEPSVSLFIRREPGAGRELSVASDSPRRSITVQFIKARMALIAGGYYRRTGPCAHALQRVDNRRPQRGSPPLTVPLEGWRLLIHPTGTWNGLKSTIHMSSSAFSED